MSISAIYIFLHLTSFCLEKFSQFTQQIFDLLNRVTNVFLEISVLTICDDSCVSGMYRETPRANQIEKNSHTGHIEDIPVAAIPHYCCVLAMYILNPCAIYKKSPGTGHIRTDSSARRIENIPVSAIQEKAHILTT